MNEGKEKSHDEPTLIECARMHLEHDRLERAQICATIAQAAALERIANMLESVMKPNGANSINVFITDMTKDTADYLREGSWLR